MRRTKTKPYLFKGERRLYVRFDLDTEAKLGTEEGRIIPARVVNIGMGGVRVRIDSGELLQHIHIDEGNTCYILIKNNPNFKAKAEIRWVAREKDFVEMGMKFVECSDVGILEKIVRRLTSSGKDEAPVEEKAV